MLQQPDLLRNRTSGDRIGHGLHFGHGVEIGELTAPVPERGCARGGKERCDTQHLAIDHA